MLLKTLFSMLISMPCATLFRTVFNAISMLLWMLFSILFHCRFMLMPMLCQRFSVILHVLFKDRFNALIMCSYCRCIVQFYLTVLCSWHFFYMLIDFITIFCYLCLVFMHFHKLILFPTDFQLIDFDLQKLFKCSHHGWSMLFKADAAACCCMLLLQAPAAGGWLLSRLQPAAAGCGAGCWAGCCCRLQAAPAHILGTIPCVWGGGRAQRALIHGIVELLAKVRRFMA